MIYNVVLRELASRISESRKGPVRMNNTEVYKKTLGFSIRRMLWDLLAMVILVGGSAAGFFIADKTSGKGLIGLGAGIVIGIVIIVFLLRYVSYTYKAGQIAMMTRGVSEGELPDDVIGEGKRIVKERFTTVAAFFAVTSVIKGIFNQLSRAITSVGESVGGDTGSAVGSAISGVVSTIVSYLCDCCLGWVFFRKDEKATKATCEGAVLFFKHGKTFAKNMGRVFGMGLLSFILIVGILGGASYLIMTRFPVAFENLSREILEAVGRAENLKISQSVVDVIANPTSLTIACAALVGIVLWSIIHSVFIRPFVLVGVLRNYIASGVNDIPTEASFAQLDAKSAKFKKLHAEAV